MTHHWIALTFVVVLPLTGCSAGEEPQAAVDRAVMSVDGGDIRGAAADEQGDVWTYRGIPYAAPPVGEWRWRPPQAVPAWEGVRDATGFSTACFQIGPPPDFLFYGPGPDDMSEDCLYLNVWTTAMPDEAHPVMVYIHGGAFQAGNGTEVTFDGSALAHRGVVVVTITYRVGPFGFLAHPLLSEESAHGASGNYGILDQIAALQWVQRNIGTFGGDPDRVTIFGGSAGSQSVQLLMATPLAKGLFQGAIGESGGIAFGTPLLARAESGGERFVARLLGDDGLTLDAMRAATPEEVMAALQTETGPTWFLPVVDGWMLTDTVYGIFAAGQQNDVPVIAGSNADEGSTFVRLFNIGPSTLDQYRQGARRKFGDWADAFLETYPAANDDEARQSFLDSYTDSAFGWDMRTWVRMMEPMSSNAYLYFFSRVPPAADAELYGAFHGAETVYVFDNLGRSPHPYANRDYDKTDRYLSDLMASYWINFATTGDPNGAGLPEWPVYGAAADEGLEFGDEVRVRSGIRKAGLDFFDRYYAAQRGDEN